MADQKEKQKKGPVVKKKPAKGVRNVLAVPYEKFWPVVNEKQGIPIETNLKKVLPLLKCTATKIPWRELKPLSKQERLERKRSLLENKDVPSKELSEHIIFGVNAVTRNLEKDNLCSILIQSTVDPVLLVKHIVMMAAHKNVPVLLVPFLSSATFDNIGFSSITIAFKKTVSEFETNEFHDTHKAILQVFRNFSIPKPTNQLPETVNTDVISLSLDDEMECEESEKTPEVNKLTISTNVYLYRSSNNERVFIPRKSNEVKVKSSMEWEDFIAMSSDNDTFDNTPVNKKRYHDNSKEINKPKKKRKEKDCYVPLKVKRKEGNLNRVKATKSKVKKTKKKFKDVCIKS